MDNSDYSSFEEDEPYTKVEPRENYESEFSIIEYKDPEIDLESAEENDENQKAKIKFIDRKRKFETQFEETIVNFTINVDFLG